MKQHVLSLCTLFLMISACSDKPREEVVNRYSTGEKELVVLYQGSGDNEIVLSKTWYHKNGFQIKYEASENGANITKDFGELNTDLSRADELFKYLSGKWVFWTHSDEQELASSYRFNSIISEPPLMEFSSNQSLTIHYSEDDPVKERTFPIQLMDEYKYVMTVPNQETHKDMLIDVEIISPDAMKLISSEAANDGYIIALREHSTEFEAIRAKAMAEKAYIDGLLNR